jgi:hypothetical protein
MADPARTPKLRFAERRDQAKKACPCNLVRGILTQHKKSAYPHCVECIFEKEVRRIMREVE